MNRFTNTKNKRAALKTFGVIAGFFLFLYMMMYFPKVLATIFLLVIFGVFVAVIFHVFKAEDKLE
jgi:hypothetical protein